MSRNTERDVMLIGVKYHPTVEHAPEPGLGGASYTVRKNGANLGRVESSWNRTSGLHWTVSLGLSLRPLTDHGGHVRTFETRAAAAYALVLAARYPEREHA